MIVSKEIQMKMHRIAKLVNESASLMNEVETYLVNKGVNIDEIRDGNGYSLEELEYGNDVTEQLIKRIEEEF